MICKTCKHKIKKGQQVVKYADTIYHQDCWARHHCKLNDCEKKEFCHCIICDAPFCIDHLMEHEDNCTEWSYKLMDVIKEEGLTPQAREVWIKIKELLDEWDKYFVPEVILVLMRQRYIPNYPNLFPKDRMQEWIFPQRKD